MKPTFPLEINFPVTMAPMVGLSHVCMRDLVRSYLPAGAKTLWPSEMLSSRRLPSEDLTQTPESMHNNEESYWVPQILGNDEKFIAPSLKKLEDHGAEGIDINMGCPVQKALKHNYGVALMGDADYAAKVVDMTVRNTHLPVSVKLRAAAENNPEVLLNFVRSLQDAGAAWVTLHPRTAEQKRKGSADWAQIRWLKENLKIPVIGNGDVQVAQDIVDMKEQTGCDLVMVGRALTARPWMLWQIGEKWGMPAPLGKEGRCAPQTPEEEGQEFYRCSLELLENMFLRFKPMLAQKKFLFHIRTSSAWLQFGHTLYAKVSKAKTQDEIRQALDDFFQYDQPMMARTEWRV